MHAEGRDWFLSQFYVCWFTRVPYQGTHLNLHAQNTLLSQLHHAELLWPSWLGNALQSPHLGLQR